MVEYWGLDEDGKYYTAPGEDAFIKAYQDNWAKIMCDAYFPSEKIDVGHKLRPRLVYWGFLSAGKNATDKDIDLIGKLGVSMELIHKASLLIDDYIDKDTARHGKPAFYVEYGVERMIIYSLKLLSQSLDLINDVFSQKNSIQYFKSMKSIISMLNSMTEGVLHELDLGSISTHDLETVREIMLLETSELITSSLVSGYYLAGGNDNDIQQALSLIGQKIGFIFQLFNDIEPYTESSHNHKGALNTDVGRGKKNYCISLLVEFTSLTEKRKLDMLADEELNDYIFMLLRKYDIIHLSLEECRKTFISLLSDIESLKIYPEWKELFTNFLQSIYNVSSSRLY